MIDPINPMPSNTADTDDMEESNDFTPDPSEMIGHKGGQTRSPGLQTIGGDPFDSAFRPKPSDDEDFSTHEFVNP